MKPEQPEVEAPAVVSQTVESPELPPTEVAPATPEHHGFRLRRLLARSALIAGGLAGVASFAGASGIDAIHFGSPEHIDIAGQDVAVKPVINQNNTNFDNVLVRQEHAHALGRDIGVNINADVNNLVPSNQQQRTELNGLWQDPKPEFARISDAAVTYVEKWGGGGAGTGLVAAGLGGGIFLYERRKMRGYTPEEQAFVRKHNHVRNMAGIAVAAVVTAGVYGTAGYTLHEHHSQTVVPNAAFNGTPLQGTEVLGLANKFVPIITGMFDPATARFYDNAQAQLEKAIASRPDLQPTDHTENIIVEDDIQGVAGMFRLVGDYAKYTHAAAIRELGDTTDFGTQLETYQVDITPFYSGGIPIVADAGKHDTATIAAAEAANKDITLADDKTHVENGISELDLNDPEISTVGQFGAGYVLRDPGTTVADFITNAVTEICKSHPEIATLHDHGYAEQIIDQVQKAGCPLPLVLTGRNYQYIGPSYHVSTLTAADGTQTSETTTEYILGSAGGHIDTLPHPGIIESTATFTELQIDTSTGDIHYVVVSIDPEGVINISRPISMEVPYAQYLKNGTTELPHTDLTHGDKAWGQTDAAARHQAVGKANPKK